MEQATLKIQIEYLDRQITDMRDQISKFIGANDKQMENLAKSISEKEGLYEERFIRRDLIELQLQNFQRSMDLLIGEMKGYNEGMAKITEFLPMLKDIKKERENLKFRIFSIAQQVAFWVVMTVLGFNILKK